MLRAKHHSAPISTYLVWQIIAYSVFAILGASIIGSVYFMYSYFYQTLSNVQTIVILNANTPLSSLNNANYTKADILVTTKDQPIVLPPTFRNIFIYGTTSTPATSTAAMPLPTENNPSSYVHPRF